MHKNFIRFTAEILIASIFFTIVLPKNGQTFHRINSQESKEKGFLILETKHKGLGVLIDGNFVGFTPFLSMALSPGLHKVTVTNPHRANWLDQDWFADVIISSGDTLRIKVVFKKSYSINSKPYGALVFYQNQKLGETPIFFSLEEDEIRTLKLAKEGFEDTTFTIGQNEQRFFNITLKPQKHPLDLSVLPSDFNFDKKPKSKKYFYSALGLAVVSGALAIYFRNKGNTNYNRYLKTGDSELMNKYFNNAKKFDKFAAVSFGVFQVSFFMSFYLFLKQANR